MTPKSSLLPFPAQLMGFNPSLPPPPHVTHNPPLGIKPQEVFPESLLTLDALQPCHRSHSVPYNYAGHCNLTPMPLQMLMVIFDILVSHRQMSKWHERRIQAHLREQQAMHTAKLELQQRLSSNAHASTSHSHAAADGSAASQGHAHVSKPDTSVALMHCGACTLHGKHRGLMLLLVLCSSFAVLSHALLCHDMPGHALLSSHCAIICCCCSADTSVP